MSEHFDELEIRSVEERENDLFSRLPDFLAVAKSSVPGWTSRLAEIDCTAITSRDLLAQIPVLRKCELMAAQQSSPPFGGFANPDMLEGIRIFMSPGPVWEPQPPGIDPWLAARSFFAAGIRKGDLVHNALSYHMTPGGFILDEGARALGANVFPGGIGNTQMQVEAAAFIKPDAYAGTPDYLKTILDKADEMGRDLSSIKRGVVSGGALFPSMREEYSGRGVNVIQAYATADFGVIAYESTLEDAALPGMVCNENLIVEIVRPGTNDPVPAGEVGELVVTNFNPAYPLVRFGTGDLSAILDEPSPCGRTNMRIKGWMGRADQRTKIKGMFVDPKQIDEVVKSCVDVSSARLVVSRNEDADIMTLQVIAVAGNIDLEAVARKLSDICSLKGEVEQVYTLPNDGKIIDDQRDYTK
ncbi:MAG: AMP-binding protein [Rhizobiaceae bacterium]|nr:AMP-binding protein [Rhizobiaceae bacterium]